MSRSPVLATDDSWVDAAYEAIKYTAVRHRRFSADLVWKRLESEGVETKDGRTLGPVMLMAVRHGLITKTGLYQPSKLRRQHGRPVPVWKSLIDGRSV